MKDSIIKNKNKYRNVLSLCILFGVWKIISLLAGREIDFPSPEATLSYLAALVVQLSFWRIVMMTVIRALVGFLIALSLAIVLGVCAGIYKPIETFLHPFVVFIKAMPNISIIVQLIIWLGTQRAPLAVGFLVIFPLLYINVVEGIKSVDPTLLEMAALYGVSPRRQIREIYMPAIFTYLIAASKSALGLNIKMIIAAEYISSTHNAIGSKLYLEKSYLNSPGVFAWTLVAVAMAMLFDRGVNWLQYRLEYWK